MKDVESSQGGGSDDMDDSTIVEIIQRPTMHKTKSIVTKPNNQSLQMRYVRDQQQTSGEPSQLSNESKNIIITQLIQNIINNNASQSTERG